MSCEEGSARFVRAGQSGVNGGRLGSYGWEVIRDGWMSW